MLITKSLFRQVFPKVQDIYLDNLIEELNILLEKYKITSKEQVAMFLAQCGHESGGFTRFTENLNYSTDRLLTVFPKYFKSRADAEKVARKPREIANIVYANRMGNGDTNSGDGYKYRGRGIIQLTGKNNYRNFTSYINEPDKFTNPDELNTIHYYVLMGVWFWKINQLETMNNIETITRRINGGTNGLIERKQLFNKIRELL